MTKIGLMGCGAVALYGHLPAIKQCKGLDLFSIYDPNSANGLKAQQEFGVSHYFDAEKPFFESGIEAISITSPAPCHLPNVLDAARYKIPVLCEKPLAMDGDEAQQMIAAMEAAGVPLYTAFCYRFSEVALKIRELVVAKAIGEVRSLRLIYNWDMHGKMELDEQGNSVLQMRRELRMLEGGPMVDCGTHQIDLANFWLDSPVVDFTARGAWVDDYEAPDHMWLHMDHASGAHTMIEISYSYEHTSGSKRKEFVYELIGTDGVIRYDREARSFRMDNGQGTHIFEFAEEKNFLGLYDELAHALKTGQQGLLTSARDGMRAVEIAREATNMAIAHRQSLKLEKATRGN